MTETFDYQGLVNPDLVFVAFDFETTGLSPSADRIIEIGAIKFKDGKILERYSALINPEIPIPFGASQINGIVDDMVRDKPNAGEVLPYFLDFIKESILIAHNAAFDVGFLKNTMGRLGLGNLNNQYVDTQRMSQKAFPGRNSYKLQILAQDFGVKALDAHRGEDDARVCMEVFQICLKRLNPSGQASFF